MVPAVFSRWFKQHMGRTFQRYVNEVRIARVCARLVDSKENITSAAVNSGYQNLANFTRRFLEITGLTPKEFRDKARQTLKTSPNRIVLRDGLHGWLEVISSKKKR
jgi:AraC-like DNA-binding protein